MGAQLFFGDDGEIVLENSVEAFLQLNVIGVNGVNGDSIVGGVAVSTDDSPTESASKTKKRLFISSSTYLCWHPGDGVGGANYQMDALFGLVEGNSGEMMHRRDVPAMRRNVSFSSQNFS